MLNRYSRLIEHVTEEEKTEIINGAAASVIERSFKIVNVPFMYSRLLCLQREHIKLDYWLTLTVPTMFGWSRQK